MKALLEYLLNEKALADAGLEMRKNWVRESEAEVERLAQLILDVEHAEKDLNLKCPDPGCLRADRKEHGNG